MTNRYVCGNCLTPIDKDASKCASCGTVFGDCNSHRAPPIPGFDQAELPPGFAKTALLDRAARRLISLYDSGELTTEALSQLVSDARKVVG